jgi:LPXTG-motif cell wall-anchored protein
VTVINFNYPDQDFTKCEPEIVTPDPQATTDTTATTLAPVVDETATAAVVSADATEVQLPASDVNLEINLADLYTGFKVAASDVKAVEYQISGGKWTAVKEGSRVKIPKDASKLSVRVTKTNGEEVISEKAIVRAAESTDTTMATAETTAPVATEEPASSDSSSSNNTLLYILGFVIVAGAAGFFIKKKSASTK